MKNILRQYKKEVDSIINLALSEDVGKGDVTTGLIIPGGAAVKGSFMAKGNGIVCGLPIAKRVFQKLDKNIRMTYKKKDGDKIKYGEIIAVVKGNARAILTGERLALNMLQRLSGVATSTNSFVTAIKPYKKTKILDTRKTTPNLRILEKYAVKKGGGENHRMGLYDMVLIKDNHLRLMGSSLEKHMVELRRFIPASMKIEIEVHNLDILETAIRVSPDIIMLDNMCAGMLDESMSIIKKKKFRGKVEVSGGVDLSNIRDMARKGVDYISVGRITHSPEALDISFKLLK